MEQNRTPRHWQAFTLALLAAALMFLPLIIYDRGYFLYFGDFNVQQIPFYKLAHEAIRSGDVLWNWYTDLGANFIGSYSFYLLFSPFFWLTLPFPTSVLPLLMGPMLMLKTACASLTAYLFLQRFVKDTRYAVLGGLLYAFSGWMDYNIFFNHFHEVAVFFPLLLIAVEELVTENRKGPMIAAVAINAMVNYWFFVGEVVFVILYVIIRRTDRTWRLTWSRFFRIAAESVMGVGLAAVVMLPSVLVLMGNPRTGLEELIMGWDFWVYGHGQRQPAIVLSLFFPPEIQARPNFMTEHGAKWASLSGWLPLVSMTGVLAYFWQRKNDWLKKMLVACLVFAMVPGLNSLFILLNHSYYARWFYMPILLMSLATVRALEDSEFDQTHYGKACAWTAGIVILFTVMCGLTPDMVRGQLYFGLAKRPSVMWTYAAIAMVSLLVTTILVTRLRSHKRFLAAMTAGVLVLSVGFNIYYMASGKTTREEGQWFIDHAINGRDQVNLPDDGVFSRMDTYDTKDNLGMYWHIPSIQTFHSIVPISIMEFYPEVGVSRDVASRPEEEFYAIRALLSVRWLFIPEDTNDQEPMPGYTYYDTQNGFNIYENDYFLPMGFTYDRFVDPVQMEDVSTEKRGNFMLRTVVLEEDAIQRNLDILEPLDGSLYSALYERTYFQDVEQRRKNTTDSFTIDRGGFTATTSFDETQFLFFSVPWEQGWSARIQVDGGAWEPVRIEKANIGFMAVRAPAGQVTIRFDYFTPGLRTGAVITGGFLVIVVGYLLLSRSYDRRRRTEQQIPDSYAAQMTGEEFQEAYGNSEERAANLQQVINEAAVRHTEETLSEDDRTLRFDGAEEETAVQPDPDGKKQDDQEQE